MGPIIRRGLELFTANKAFGRLNRSAESSRVATPRTLVATLTASWLSEGGTW